MNIKITIGIFAALLLVSVLWLRTSNEVTTGDHMMEVAEHNDSLESYEVSPSTVVKRVQANEGVVLLDVRTLDEYEELHLENALLLPVQELNEATLANIGLGEDSKDMEIILYCRSGSRSQTAYNIMKALGYTNIKSVSGGMVHWQEDKYPLTESGAYSGTGFLTNMEAGVVSDVGPALSVDKKMHDFGLVPQYGGKVETTFNLTNTGKEDLEIGTITTSCSCTSASVEKLSLKPSESTVMKVVFDPNLHEEPFDVFKRTVFIPTNDPNNPELEVSVQVDIAEGE